MSKVVDKYCAKLYIFSGLPGSGKSTLAQELAKKLSATFLRIDTIEQALRDICKMKNVEGEGYGVSYLIAKENLFAGHDVIADSVNPWAQTRDEWNEVAISAGAKFVNIEVICSDKTEHKLRVENRKVNVKNLLAPTWDEVLNRDYQEWHIRRLVIDTAGKSVEASVEELFSKLSL